MTAIEATPPRVDTRVAVAARSVSKRYGGVQALLDASLEIRPGTVHGLLGENGAGKSTLVKILAGAVAPDSGGILVAGEPVRLGSPAEARRLGIAVVHQELSLFPHLTVPSNVFAGRELHGAFGSLKRQLMHDELVVTMEDIGWSVPLDRPVGRLSLAEQQMVEIVRAFHHRADLVLLDEPNSALTEAESEALFAAVRRFQARGQAFLLVSHRLDEVLAIADEVTILRDGHVVHHSPARDLSVRDAVRLMVGAVAATAPAREAKAVGAVSLEVERLRSGRLLDLSFDLHEGEIIGVAGLDGSGVQDLFDALFGTRRPESGSCRFGGEPYEPASPGDAIARGVASIPADRRTEGLLMARPVSENIALVILDRLRSRRWFVSDGAIRQTAQRFVERLRIRTASVDSSVTTLSGGNQQKVVLSKWLAMRPKLLLLNDPTRGIDVGAKAEVHEVIRELASDGMAILVWSSEYDELLGLCDRILVLHEGRLLREAVDRVDDPERPAARSRRWGGDMTAHPAWLVIGHGSVGSALVRRLVRAGLDPVVYDPSPRVPVVDREHLRSLDGTARSFDRVISCVAPSAAHAALADARLVLHAGTLYLDWNTVAPAVKRGLAAAAPCPVIDVALLDTLDEEAAAPSIAISGAEAADAVPDLVALEFHVDVVGEAAGDAALLKYARSIFMKTLEALVVEFEAAIATLPGRDIVTASIERNLGPTFMDFARMLLETDRIHAARRADELAGAVRAHEEAGLAVPLAAAAVEVLRDAALAWQEPGAPPIGAAPAALAAYLARHLDDRRVAAVGGPSDARR